MARIGVSPQRRKLLTRQPRRIALTMITHIPYLTGYYKDHVRITELSLNSMVEKATHEGRLFDVIVFDQDSCAEWKQKLISLQDAGYVDGLYLSSYNMGKLNALRFLMNSIQSVVFGYTDDDVLFFPAWLDQQMELFSNPAVDVVSGSPVATRFKWYKNNLARLKQYPEAEVEEVTWKDMPFKWIEQDAICRGLHPDEYVQILETKREDDIDPSIVHFTDDDIKAWAVGHHMQFLGDRKSMVRYLPPVDNALMGQMRDWDINMDKGGVSHVTTFKRTCRHMGNVLDNDIVDEAIDMGMVL